VLGHELGIQHRTIRPGFLLLGAVIGEVSGLRCGESIEQKLSNPCANFHSSRKAQLLARLVGRLSAGQRSMVILNIRFGRVGRVELTLLGFLRPRPDADRAAPRDS
jgi:hypothetical protein